MGFDNELGVTVVGHLQIVGAGANGAMILHEFTNNGININPTGFGTYLRLQLQIVCSLTYL
jgi:hypothetical protein